MTKQSLDAIIILGGPSEKETSKRVSRAVEETKKRKVDFLIATGGKTPALSKKYKHEAQDV